MKLPHNTIVVCIFAHPDDEAFGPGGTIAKLARENKVYLISATKGESGKEKGKRGSRGLGLIRAQELQRSAKILGVKKVFFLGFRDGELCNNLYHGLAAKIEQILKNLKPEFLITHEPRGGSGHIDHITVSMATSFVFARLPFVKKILQHCMSEKRARARKNYFIYIPPGYKKSEIGLTVDIQDVWNIKVEAMMQHQSQVHDSKRILRFAKKFPKEENFLIISK